MFNQKLSYSFPIIGIVLLGLLLCFGEVVSGQTKIQVGVFDSRAVAVAFYQSKFSNIQETFGLLHTRMAEAKGKEDKTAIASIERESTLRQAMMHEQGFGRGSVNSITETVKEKLMQLAKDENLSTIVSKWELVYCGDDVVTVDVTEKIVDFFEPNEKMKLMTKEIMGLEPLKDAYLIED